jgi:hypothetical protein
MRSRYTSRPRAPRRTPALDETGVKCRGRRLAPASLASAPRVMQVCPSLKRVTLVVFVLTFRVSFSLVFLKAFPPRSGKGHTTGRSPRAPVGRSISGDSGARSAKELRGRAVV